jgi:hypothetical protein
MPHSCSDSVGDGLHTVVARLELLDVAGAVVLSERLEAALLVGGDEDRRAEDRLRLALVVPGDEAGLGDLTDEPIGETSARGHLVGTVRCDAHLLDWGHTYFLSFCR